MSSSTAIPKISSVADLFAIAYRIEADAVERYALLADQMETHNNPELVKIFRDLARAETVHRDEIGRLAGNPDIARDADRIPELSSGDGPEEADLGAAHYLMTPWHALQLALAGEQRALDFFTAVAGTAKDPQIKKLAEELVEEEAEHVNLVHRLLRTFAPPLESWARDDDPPVPQE